MNKKNACNLSARKLKHPKSKYDDGENFYQNIYYSQKCTQNCIINKRKFTSQGFTHIRKTTSSSKFDTATLLYSDSYERNIQVKNSTVSTFTDSYNLSIQSLGPVTRILKPFILTQQCSDTGHLISVDALSRTPAQLRAHQWAGPAVSKKNGKRNSERSAGETSLIFFP